MDVKTLMAKAMEMKKQWEKDHPGQKLEGNMMQQAQQMFSTMDPATKAKLIQGFTQAKQAATEVIAAAKTKRDSTPTFLHAVLDTASDWVNAG